MASLNVCSFTGRAGRDPEMKFYESGSAIAQLTIAVDGWKRDSEPLWLNLKVWGKLAQVAGDYVRKGSQIAVSGQLENESWTDRTTGEKRSKMVLNVKELTLLGSKKDAEAGGGAGAGGYQPAPDDDDDIPF
jgi:single-strand DNA-binding protein